MRALTWHGKHDVRVDTVPDPEIINPRDATIEVTSTAICGSNLHLFDGVIPGMQAGDILGHEFMGRVVEVGPGSTLKKGQRVVVPFVISCRKCFFCERQQFSACDNSDPAEEQDLSEPLHGHAMSGLFGYSHLTGGYPGGQAEYVRVPFSDVGPIVVPDGLDALQDGRRDSAVTLTCLMPGPTDTPIFTRPDNLLAESPIARRDSKDNVTLVARAGYDAMMAGDNGVVPGLTNKLIAMFAGLVPQSILAEMHRRGAKPV